MTPEAALTEIREHHEYLRQMFELLVTWFIFFITVLLTAYSWVLVSDAKTKVQRVVRQIGVFFLAQIGLGIGACCTAAYYFHNAGETLRELGPQAGLPRGTSAFPEAILLTVCCLMTATLFANVGFWVWIMYVRRV